jgi:hypothetical protein
MRAFAVCLVLCFAFLVRGAHAQNAGPDASPAAPEDRVPMLIGNWTCVGADHSTSRMSFTRQHDDSIAGTIFYHFANREPGQQDEFHETYRFDQAANRWVYEWDVPETHLTTGGTGPEWTGDMWTLNGEVFVHYYIDPSSEAVQHQLKRPMRVIYQATGNDTVQRDIQLQDRGTWMKWFQSMCTRDH